MAGILIKDYIGAGVFASRPTTPSVVPPATASYYATDTGVYYIWDNVANAWDTISAANGIPTGGATGEVLTKDSGTDYDVSWQPAGGGGSAWDFAPPVAATFSTVSGDATNVTLTDDADVGLIINNGALVTGNIQRFAVASLASSGAANFSYISKLRCNSRNLNMTVGMCLRESATGKQLMFGVQGNSISAWYGTMTTYSTGIVTQGAPTYFEGLWLRIDFNFGTGIYTFYTSVDGKGWTTEGTVAATSAFTTRASHYGYGFQNGVSSTIQPRMSVPYISLT